LLPKYSLFIPILILLVISQTVTAELRTIVSERVVIHYPPQLETARTDNGTDISYDCIRTGKNAPVTGRIQTVDTVAEQPARFYQTNR
jgi:hypothetical protein